jgi:hypothetical protein
MKMPDNTKVREKPYFTLNGAVRYLPADSLRRESILLDFKYPKPEGEAQARYYGPARAAIREYHLRGNDRAVFNEAEERLLGLLGEANPHKAAMLEHNIRVMRTYPAHFAKRRLKVLPSQPREVDVEGVTIRLCPDLVAVEGSRTRIIRLAFQKDGADDIERRLSVQFMKYYAQEAGLQIGSADCQLFVVADGTVAQLCGTESKFHARLRAAMREVRRVWPNL